MDELGQALRWARTQLGAQQRDAEVLLSHLLGMTRAQIYTWPQQKLSTRQSTQFQQWIQRRQQGEPVAYIVGVKEFWSLAFTVTPAVLIPRPETEHLVETILAYGPEAQLNCRAIDLGVGSGALTIALAKERPNWDWYGLEYHQQALAIAQCNAVYHGSNIHWIQGHWLQCLASACIDLIISNPPYIANHDPQLEAAVINYEPRAALISAQSGLADIAQIIEQAPRVLKPKGYLALEHGAHQGAAVHALYHQAGFEHIFTVTDLNGWPRITMGQWLN